jgi:hypothetical protein
LAKAQQLLSSLPIAEGRTPNIAAMNGWVFEQTIRHCLSHELKGIGIYPTIKEQQPVEGRVKVDLLIGKIALEVKVAGSFGHKDVEKYSSYRARVEQKGWIYCYLTGGETYDPYRTGMKKVFGNERAFFLDAEGEWQRFVQAIAENCE